MLILFSLYAVFSFLFGITIGSFLNVCIYRIPAGLSVAEGRSFCPCCKKQLKSLDMIPIVSFLLLRGKCRFCKHPISVQYPLVELASGLLFLLAFFVFGPQVKTVFVSLFFVLLLTIGIIDQKTGFIYDRMNLAVLVLAVIFILCTPGESMLSHLLGALVLSVPLLLLAVLLHGFGGGDIKLAFCAGLFLGFRLMLMATFLSVVSCGLYSILLLCRNKASGKTELPFGPFLAFGMIASMVIGNPILLWYSSFFL